MILEPGTHESFISLAESPNAYAAEFGYIFGLFPTNFLHDLVRCAVGLLGIVSYNSAKSTRLFNATFAVAYDIKSASPNIPQRWGRTSVRPHLNCFVSKHQILFLTSDF
ncbi:DUF4383 domain-containing protein [Nostoc sp. FACHB-87]|nr:DUF4383 domain-containing protein [Nostoc sp. FACHB-190]MBD2453876.1 DUF4383 domain-containing protein [Nostoc sp. FACHB-87]MBD2475999.1 DUF4383 domain-containing protein [Anabaena sp. FACHB-83]